MPQSIAAFVYFDDETALQAGQGQDLRLADKIVAVTNYAKLLDYYKLSERDLPLLKVNRSELTFEDVSFGARKFLANHSYETYRKQNPYRKANPPASVVTDENETAVAVDGALPRAWPSPSPSPSQAGQEQQLAHDHQAHQAQERKAEVIGTNERVVSGELLRCQKPCLTPTLSLTLSLTLTLPLPLTLTLTLTLTLALTRRARAVAGRRGGRRGAARRCGAGRSGRY